EVLGDQLGVEGYIIYVDKDAFQRLDLGEHFPFFKRDRESFFSLSEEQSEELFELAKHMATAFQANAPLSYKILQAYLQIFLCKSAIFFDHKKEKTKHSLRLMARFEALVHQQYVQHKSVQYYARELAISTRQLSSITQQVIGKSPLRFIHDIVLNESKSLLVSSKMTTSEVSYTLGFEEVAHFSRFFKKYVGIPPSLYKEKHRNG
ncbi:MAG: AraC family transcriptional regulator, partial [Bacteroidota bacterium]